MLLVFTFSIEQHKAPDALLAVAFVFDGDDVVDDGDDVVRCGKNSRRRW